MAWAKFYLGTRIVIHEPLFTLPNITTKACSWSWRNPPASIAFCLSFFLFLLQPHPIYPAMPCIPKDYLRENNYSKVPSAKPFRGGILGVISRPGQEGEYTQCDTVKQRKRGSEICRSNMRGRGRMQTQIEIKYMIISQYVKILNHYVVYLKLT